MSIILISSFITGYGIISEKIEKKKDSYTDMYVPKPMYMYDNWRNVKLDRIFNEYEGF